MEKGDKGNKGYLDMNIMIFQVEDERIENTLLKEPKYRQVIQVILIGIGSLFLVCVGS